MDENKCYFCKDVHDVTVVLRVGLTDLVLCQYCFVYLKSTIKNIDIEDIRFLKRNDYNG